MEKLFNVIRKLLLTFNWLFFGAIISGLMLHAFNLDDDVDQTNNSPEWIENILSVLSIFSDNPTFNWIIVVSFCVFIVGYIVHSTIQWIFN